MIEQSTATRQAAGLSKREALRIAVMKLLHPLVSPYDLSEINMKANWYNNPGYRHAVESICSFIEDKIEKD